MWLHKLGLDILSDWRSNQASKNPIWLGVYISQSIHGTGIFTYIYHKNQLSVGEYTYMDSIKNRMGTESQRTPKLRSSYLDTQVCSGSVKRGSDRWRFLGIHVSRRPFRGVIRKVGGCFHSRGQDS